MKIAVTGPRQAAPIVEDFVKDWVWSLSAKDTTLFHGDAKGVDHWARDAAKLRGMEVVKLKPPYGLFPSHLAPLIRNAELVSRVDAIMGFWHGEPYGGTLSTLWFFRQLHGRVPDWTLIPAHPDGENFDNKPKSLATFDAVVASPPPHWLEALQLWKDSK